MTPTIDIYRRTTPNLPWGVLAVVSAIAVALAAGAWEFHCRSLGYTPHLNDTRDLWVDQRRHVDSDAIVICGSSRGLFGLDLDTLATGLGRKPIQLCLVGSCIYPVLKNLADDTSFHGTVICDLVPGLLLVPTFAPPYINAERAVARLNTQTYAQRWSFALSMPLERTCACLQQEDLTLADLLHGLPIPNRAHAQIGPDTPPCFSWIDRDRRTRMRDRVLTDETLRNRVKFGWIPLFTPPPKPHWIPDQAFGDFIHHLIEDRFAAMAAAVKAIQVRGGKVVFLRMPSTGDLRVVEDRLAPKAQVWDRVLKDTGAPGIFADDHAELASFDLPEWSHLSAADSVTFTERLVPYLHTALNEATALKP
jgi:hypothetical protein